MNGILLLLYVTATWNFHESSHGKGIPDGVGATIMRLADSAVLHGTDVENATDLMAAIELMKLNIPSLPKIMATHQLITTSPNVVHYRVLSCDCMVPVCACYSPNMLMFHVSVSDVSMAVFGGTPANVAETSSCVEKVCDVRGESLSASISSKGKPSNGRVQSVSAPVSCTPANAAETSSCVQKSCNVRGESLSASISCIGRPKPSDVHVESMSASESTCVDETRSQYFRVVLQKLHHCATFEYIVATSTRLECSLSYTLGIPTSPSHVDVDQQAIKYVPNDVDCAGSDVLVPMTVSADGDCLPHTGSVHAFGHERYSDEIRARIVMELASYSDTYLDSNYLQRGTTLSDRQARNLPVTYAMYSDHYDPSTTTLFTDELVSRIYKQEVMDITSRGSFMGIWQLFALASVLGRTVRSVYPQLGNPNVRGDLNRTLLPRVEEAGVNAVRVMWTSTRTDDMNPMYFVPNHFVPLLHVGDDHLSTDYLDRHVIVMYNEKPYPGLVLNVDTDDVSVRCMHRVGQNRFYWPSTEDVCWYNKDQIVAVIPPPTSVTSRHMQIDAAVWKSLQ